MTARIRENQLKAVLFMILFVALILQSFMTSAQRDNRGPYRGFAASFGTRIGMLSSNIQKINETDLILSGAQLGLVFGNKILRSKLGVFGYYSSTGKTGGTIDLYQSNVSVNFYPLSLLSKKTFLVEPYVTAGMDYDQFKFYGHYLNREPGTINYSQTEAPYVGKVKQINATTGMGIEVKLKDRFDFIHLFSEVRFGHNLSAKAKNTALENTAVNNQTQIIVGISFGAHR